MKMFRTIKCGLLGAFLLLGFVAPLTFTSCENSHPEINLEFKSDYSGIIDAINKTNASLAEKLANIESAIKEGTLKNAQALDAIKAAVASMEGTVAQKLAAIESAVKDQTTSFETKMALIETALNEGFADVAEGQDLMKQALESLEGTVAEKLAAVEKAVKDQTLSLETKLDLINTTVEEGFASIKEGQDLIVAALEAIDGTLQDKMDALEKAIKAQTTTLAAKLAAIEAAVKAGFADEVKALGLVKDAVKAVDGTLKTKLDALKAAVEDQTLALKTKLQLIREAITEGFANEAEALDLIEKAIKALPDYTDIFGDIKTALTNINYNLSANGAIVFQLASLNNALSGEGGTNEVLAAIVEALAGDPADDTNNGIKGVLEAILDELAGTDDEDGIKDALESIAEALAAIAEALNNEQGGGDGPVNPDQPGTINGYEYVEMGDGLKWATMNVGATKPEEYGDYFAWGETTTKSNYAWSTYFDNPSGDGQTFIKYFSSGGKTLLDPEDDAASINWNSTWRTPTYDEWTWLVDNCVWTWTDDYEETGAAGMIVTGTTGNSIFLPAAGYRSESDLTLAGADGYYWASSIDLPMPSDAKRIHIASGVAGKGHLDRYLGFSIRPVSDKRTLNTKHSSCFLQTSPVRIA